MSEKKYYWLKLERNFFKRHDIRIVEDMPNGKDYILFYMKLLVESVDHSGSLRFSDTIPYNEQMLSTITNTNIDIVRAAMEIFTSLDMIQILDDNTIYMKEVERMIGSASNTDNANRQRRFREKKKLESLPDNIESVTKCNASVTDDVTNDNESKSKNKRKSKSIEKDIFLSETIGEKKFIPPTIEEVYAYCESRHNNINPQLFFDYYSAKNWSLGGDPVHDWKALLRTWENNQKKEEWE